MIAAWSVADVRAAEERAMSELPDGELMARASKGLAKVVAARIDDIDHPRVVGIVGSGGNGGDTLFALARLARLDERRGGVAGLAAVLVSDHGAHEAGLAAARKVGVTIVDLASAGTGDEGASDQDTSGDDANDEGANGDDTNGDATNSEEALAHACDLVAEADVLLDGITGIGGSPGWSGSSAARCRVLLDAVDDDAYVIAVDLPSGADPAGIVLDSEGVWADETVTFGVAKPVHLLGTAARCGLLTLVDIGLEMTTAPVVERLDHDDVAALWPVPGPDDDKYSRGVLGVVAGGESFTGAPILTVTAAVSAGVGMVRYLGPPTPTSLVRAAVPEAVHGLGRVQAWVVGPGLDTSVENDDGDDTDANADDVAQVTTAREALDSGQPCLVDAGGLDLLDGRRPRAGARTLLTPHAGELARLLSRVEDEDVTREAVEADPVGHARRAANLLHATVLLKGSTTYVVPPEVSGIPVRACADAPTWMGTAGSGDVLAGLAGTLLASGLDPYDAGSVAAVVHGLAGHEANPGGPVRALDVAHAIPRVVAGLLRHAAA
ncbi:bifunctional ADP-dependent NAD(P)H-hydrate dehydratase/NAD(P)H-hydrate epimerase [Mobilicoccus massiliensis]|uniref:bifunctional ADP-dependent NAD(P)H-hydrate dehydratase/NAD(P)H-hydrate epimerase n=1 Tax=Mobilicoccus massiliensis TaxID=1522310 RepID=UPI00058E262F|nr:bifunctional ADP-dependent NAD(P)H-hydrate dehydratase/NAD(P)H-hydrate epimerase [Mobilicoccus massiliensis]